VSIVTKTGDDGTTGLMYNRRVSKCHPRVATYGAVDELNAALGMARGSGSGEIKERLETIQKELVGLMGELATLAADSERYKKDGYAILSESMTLRLEKWAKEIEAKNISFKGWATPGASLHAAALDFARTVCRRAERLAWGLKEAGDLGNNEITVYLNRLSDLLWLWAREVEQRVGGK
jgi:cob(I)alamin adenosyltransferase